MVEPKDVVAAMEQGTVKEYADKVFPMTWPSENDTLAKLPIDTVVGQICKGLIDGAAALVKAAEEVSPTMLHSDLAPLIMHQMEISLYG